MIFIKDKKAWKEFVKDHDGSEFPDGSPSEFPLYLYIDDLLDGHDSNVKYSYIYQFDAQSMLEKLENGREF